MSQNASPEPFLQDRVKDTTTTTGTGTITNTGTAPPAYVPFATAFTVAFDIFKYLILDPATGDWEVGSGTLATSTTMTRSVESSSNSNALVSFVAGTKYVSCVSAASSINRLDTRGRAIGRATAGEIP